MSATIREVVTDAQYIVGEISGAGTQAFSEDRQMQDAIRAFNMLFKKYYWEQYLLWHEVVLDETTGKITTDAFGAVADFEDFVAVHRENEKQPIGVMPKRLNPFTMTGTRVLYFTSLHVSDTDYNGKKLQFYPKLAVANLQILARTYPFDPSTTEWDWDDTMHLDRDMLAAGTAYMTLVGDDLNASAADLAKSQMEGRFKDIMAALAKHPQGGGSGADIPSQYYAV